MEKPLAQNDPKPAAGTAVLQPVAREDLPACAALIRQAFATVAEEFGFTRENAPRFTSFAVTEERLAAQWEEGRPMFTALSGEGALVGYYSLALPEPGVAELNNLAVLPACRHQGLGEALLTHACRQARAAGAQKLTLGLVEENARLRRWYEAHGFTHTGTKKFDFFPFTCGYMEKALAPVAVAVLGLNGAGKSTLAHALARELSLFEMDGEDYYFPDQAEDRRWALDHQGAGLPENREHFPFSHPVSKEEAAAALLRDAAAHPDFVLSCVRLNWGPALSGLLTLAVVLDTPAPERLRRLEDREIRRFGDRVLPGGDMAAQQEAFRAQCAGRGPEEIEASLAGLTCPILRLDGARPTEENLQVIRQFLQT